MATGKHSSLRESRLNRLRVLKLRLRNLEAREKKTSIDEIGIEAIRNEIAKLDSPRPAWDMFSAERSKSVESNVEKG